MQPHTAVGTVVGHLDDLAVAAMKMVKVDGHRLCLVRTSEGVFALDQACPHEGYGLTTGELDGDLITCAWHNWKFRVTDGACVLGEEDVRTHPVHVADDGTLSVEFREPDPAELRPKIMTSLRSGIERQYVGQISRDVVRLLRADSNPGELIWEAVAYGAPRAEFGWGHSIASLTDCLSMVDHYDGDDRALPIVQAIAGVSETERGRPVEPVPDPLATMPADPRAEFRRLVEAERLEPAQALLRGAIASGAGADELRPWFTDVVSDHLLSYGHGAIYAQKAFQLLDRLGWDRADTVLPYLVPTIVYGTREDKLPYMQLFHRGVAQLDLTALAERAGDPDRAWVDDGRLLAALLGNDRTEAALATGASLAAGASLDSVLDVVVLAVSERMLRYDPAGEFDFHDDFGWLDITHGLTYANAARWHVTHGSPDGRRHPPDPVDGLPRQLDRPPRVARRRGGTGRRRAGLDRSGRVRPVAAARVVARRDDGVHRARSRGEDECGVDGGGAAARFERAPRRNGPLPRGPEARTLRRRHGDQVDRLPERPHPTRLTLRDPRDGLSAIGTTVGRSRPDAAPSLRHGLPRSGDSRSDATRRPGPRHGLSRSDDGRSDRRGASV